MTVKIENGTFAYKGGGDILKNICLEADSGDLVAILGPNGAGKTTLLRCMMGFLPWKSGRSTIDGGNISAMSQRELWQKLAYVPQARSVSTAFSVREMVLIGRSSRIGLLRTPSAADIEATGRVMEKLGISALAEKKCSELSGGELQMVLIARALASEPKILILDEPESNLDFKNQLIVLDVMSELAFGGMTCIFNTHYPAHALQRANRALMLKKGGEYIFGDTADVVTEDNIARAFGVKAVIGSMDTPVNTLMNVVPIEITSDTGGMERSDRQSERRIAVIAIIATDYDVAEKINSTLHKYNSYLVGRMGMPYKRCGVHIINITLDAPERIIDEVTGSLSGLPGVSVKATFAKGEYEQEDNK